jgi:hypothetical protein
MFEGKKKVTNGYPLVAAVFHIRVRVYPPAPPDVWVIRMRATVVSAWKPSQDVKARMIALRSLE